MKRYAVHVFAVVRDWFLNPACPWCGERSAHLEWHYAREHAGDQLL